MPLLQRNLKNLQEAAPHTRDPEHAAMLSATLASQINLLKIKKVSSDLMILKWRERFYKNFLYLSYNNLGSLFHPAIFNIRGR